jgi:hypothetical protein
MFCVWNDIVELKGSLGYKTNDFYANKQPSVLFESVKKNDTVAKQTCIQMTRKSRIISWLKFYPTWVVLNTFGKAFLHLSLRISTPNINLKAFSRLYAEGSQPVPVEKRAKCVYMHYCQVIRPKTYFG